MKEIIKPILIVLLALGVLALVGYVLQGGKGPQRADPSKYVHRDPNSMDQVAGKHIVNTLDRARAATDLANVKQAYSYHVNQYVIDHGVMPTSLDQLIQAGMDPKFLKDQSGLQVHYELMPDGRQAKVFTYGPDHTGGTEDDVIIYVP